MSRFGDGDYEPIFGSDGKPKETSGLWRANVQRALKGRRGQAALRDFRDALMALPEKVLIEGALCTVGIQDRIESLPTTVTRPHWKTGEREVVNNWEREVLVEYVDQHKNQPEGVCAIGAYVWWKKVKSGMSPEDAFAATPVLPDTDGGQWETEAAGREAGLAGVLALDLAFKNDENLGGATPEERYEWFLKWVNKQIAETAA